MRINSLSYSNFRNFKDEGKINFNTDGKITVIYGSNGAGKTTLHQLFQWIVYGETHFNATSGDELYNTTLYDKARIGDVFEVWGSIDFTHNNHLYTAKREQSYKKQLKDVIKFPPKFSVAKKNTNGDWIKVDDPDRLIQSILPKGLSNYFFFDGERMIDDLKKKGKDSAKNLKNALYNILDLSIYDDAIDLIGKKEIKSTVIGSLFSRKTDCSDNELMQNGFKRDAYEKQITRLEMELNSYDEKIEQLSERIRDISEEIGSAKSKKDYEKERSDKKTSQKHYEDFLSSKLKEFMKSVINIAPNVFLSKAIDKVSLSLQEDIKNNKIIDGLNRTLIDSLLESDTCICGNKLNQKEREALKYYYSILPPNNYDYLYKNFINNSQKLISECNIDKFKEIIADANEFDSLISKIDDEIIEIDKKIKDDDKFQDLIDERVSKEEEYSKTRIYRDECNNKLYTNKKIISQLIDKIDKQTENKKGNDKINEKIDIMNEVKSIYEKTLIDKANSYSKKLEKEINNLLLKMLEAKEKHAEVSNDFKLVIKDNFGNEYKSTGQITTVTFAYIAAIFKVLKDENLMENKEFPLILDAPFSNLTPKSREIIIKTVPDYAPQIIILSKDNLQDSIPSKFLGNVYTIKPNRAFNVATIEEGFSYDD